jgi:WD40 repeat protein
VLLVSESAEIQAVRPDGRTLVSASGFRGSSPRLSPDGQWLVATRSGELWLQPFGGDDSRARRITARGRDGVWSPTGQRLAFVRGHALWSIGVDSRQSRLIWLLQKTQVPSPDSSAIDWSPDGRRLVFADSEGRLWDVGIATPRIRRLGPAGLRGFAPRWSPNGALVALVDEDGWLTVLNTRTGSVRLLAGGVDGYAWSPDGQFLAISRTIVYECDDDPYEGCQLGELSIVRLRNGGTRQQLRSDALGTVFDWRH